MSAPLISYHGGHSAEFCDHAAAESTTEGNVKAYLERGFRHFAITEHRPPHEERFVYPDEIGLGHTAEFLQQRFQRYFDEVRPRIFQSYGDKAHIAIGFETEYYGKDPVGQTVKLVERYNPDLLVLSVHHVNDIPIDFSAEKYVEAMRACGGIEKLYLRYYEHQNDFMRGLAEKVGDRPVIIGHFDLIKVFAAQAPEGAGFVYDSFSPELRAAIERNIDTAVKNKFVFDLNARSFRKGLSEPYPGEQILRLIREKGGVITLGDDSHGPEQVGLNFDRAVPFAKKFFDSAVAFEREGFALRRVSIPL